MRQRPPRSTRADTLFAITTLFKRMANWQALRQRSLPSDLSCLGRLPRLRGGHLRRSRFALPAVGMPRSISVVAPSGFGKTQLLAFWFYDLRARGYETDRKSTRLNSSH